MLFEGVSSHHSRAIGNNDPKHNSFESYLALCKIGRHPNAWRRVPDARRRSLTYSELLPCNSNYHIHNIVQQTCFNNQLNLIKWKYSHDQREHSFPFCLCLYMYVYVGTSFKRCFRFPSFSFFYFEVLIYILVRNFNVDIVSTREKNFFLYSIFQITYNPNRMLWKFITSSII